MQSSIMHTPRAGRHSRAGKQLACFLTASSLLLGTALFPMSGARADEISMCGHKIITNYYFGWVFIRSVSGITFENQRTDIYVYGNTDYGWDRMPAIAAMGTPLYGPIHWGWMNSRIAIAGYDDCRDAAHCCNVILH